MAITEGLLILQAIPGMLLALVLSFDHHKSKDIDVSSKGFKYVWYALLGYAVGLVSALAAGILSQSAQPALLYLVSFIILGSKYLSLFNYSLGLFRNNPQNMAKYE